MQHPLLRAFKFKFNKNLANLLINFNIILVSRKFKYPDGNAEKYAHIFMCLQIQKEDIENILKNLLIAKVRVYSKKIPQDMLERVQDSIYEKIFKRRFFSKYKSAVESFKIIDSPSTSHSFAIITKTSKELINVWTKTQNKLGLNDDLVLKSYPNFECKNYLGFKEVFDINIDRIKWRQVFLF